MKTLPKTWFFILATIVLGACGGGTPTGSPETGVVESSIKNASHEACSALWNSYFNAGTNEYRIALLGQIQADGCLYCWDLTEAWYQAVTEGLTGGTNTGDVGSLSWADLPDVSSGELQLIIDALGPACIVDPDGHGCVAFRCR